MKNILNSLKEFLLNMLKDPQIYKFLIVGIVNAILLLILTILFTDYLNIFYLFSSIMAYEITIILGFFIHEYWTFVKVKKIKKSYVRFLQYNIFYFLGLVINSGFVFMLTSFFELHYSSSQFFAIIIVFLFNFFTSKKITFKN
jgi:putative flippase GtrA